MGKARFYEAWKAFFMPSTSTRRIAAAPSKAALDPKLPPTPPLDKNVKDDANFSTSKMRKLISTISNWWKSPSVYDQQLKNSFTSSYQDNYFGRTSENYNVEAKTGTVGICFADINSGGIGADRRATIDLIVGGYLFGPLLYDDNCCKLHIISDNITYTFAGKISTGHWYARMLMNWAIGKPKITLEKIVWHTKRISLMLTQNEPGLFQVILFEKRAQEKYVILMIEVGRDQKLVPFFNYLYFGRYCIKSIGSGGMIAQDQLEFLDPFFGYTDHNTKKTQQEYLFNSVLHAMLGDVCCGGAADIVTYSPLSPSYIHMYKNMNQLRREMTPSKGFPPIIDYCYALRLTNRYSKEIKAGIIPRELVHIAKKM